MSLTPKKLGKIEKALAGVYADNPAEFAEIQKKLAGVRAAMDQGEHFSKSDLQDILGGDVEVTPLNPIEKGEGADDDHPLAPIFLDFYKTLVDDKGVIRKGQDPAAMQEAFEKAYQAAADIFDTGLNAAVEAAAIEFTSAGVSLAKHKKNGKPVTGEDVEDEDMEKMLKGTVAGRAILKQLKDLGDTVQSLQAERDLSVFTKQASDIGEGAAFAPELAKLHKLDPKLAASIAKRLQTKNELISKSRAWGEELGDGGLTNGGDGAGAIEKMNTLAREKVTKSEGKMTFAKAFTQVCAEQPELYSQYQKEQREMRR